jgi:uncharacterized protein (TIGR00661 family)
MSLIFTKRIKTGLINSNVMKKIIFGVQGEGMGHAIRSYIVIKSLQKKYKVKIFAGNRAYTFLSGHFSDVNEIESQNMIYKNNKVSLLGTIAHNVKKFKDYSKSYNDTRKIAKEFEPDLAISDYDPITLYVAKSLKIPLIALSNQKDITFRKAGFPITQLLSFFNTQVITLAFTWNATKHVVYSINPQKSTKKKLYTGNLIREEMLKQKARYGKHIFVYQTSSSNLKLIDALKEIDEQFIVYGFNEDKIDKNLTFRKFNNTIFYKDLCTSKALIVNGGLTTISEGVYLKKPILALPISGQFEQYFNAKVMEKNGFGMCAHRVDKDVLLRFLKNIGQYKKNLRDYKGLSNKEILATVDSAISDVLNNNKKQS